MIKNIHVHVKANIMRRMKMNIINPMAYDCKPPINRFIDTSCAHYDNKLLMLLTKAIKDEEGEVIESKRKFMLMM